MPACVRAHEVEGERGAQAQVTLKSWADKELANRAARKTREAGRTWARAVMAARSLGVPRREREAGRTLLCREVKQDRQALDGDRHWLEEARSVTGSEVVQSTQIALQGEGCSL